MTVEALLSRLQRVKRTGPGKWIASCPTREDRSPSLAIRELDDGTVLLHDFGGDDVQAILASVGLDFSDLYPAAPPSRAKPVQRRFNASDVLAFVAFEATVAALLVNDALNRGELIEDDYQRLMTAAMNLGDAAEVCNGGR